MDRIINEILDALFFGYQPMEVIWENVGNYTLPKNIVGKPPEWFSFWTDNSLRFRTRENFMGEELPPRKFLLPRHRATYKNPYGFPLLSRCFWPVAFKKGGLKFWMTFTEKYGMPFSVGKLPRGSSKKDINDLLGNLQNMVQDAVAVIPDDSSVEIIAAGASKASGELYESLCQFNNTEISKAILGQTLTTEIGKTGGSHAASKTHQEVRGDLVMGDKKLVQGIFNLLIRWIMEINFPAGGDCPKLSFYEEENIDQSLPDRDKKLSDMGVRFNAKYYQEEYNLAKDQFTVVDVAPKLPVPGALPISEGQSEGSVTPTPAPTAGKDLAPQDSAIAKKTPVEKVVSDNAKIQFSEFKKPEPHSFPDQEKLDAALNLIPNEQLQAFSEGLLKPVFNMIQNGGSAEEIMTGLAKAYPKMEDAGLQEALTQALFVSEIWGRLNADK